ncbi:helix-turn-helix domain-containing protein [Pontivivens ytuae]|uniref:Helix-turn-helix transcriptional regulator n=1 Tax=Pontivivens ytuae TaxID=2789856 RepID=A0A7S9LSP1_9RHOB|nr:AraC family transcriptional regulator [Pontivivens ytuae]QPH54522.1 helix-turn-helix transcriptional regulator [Pontivivens ytuae]
MTWTIETNELRAFWGVVPPPTQHIAPSVSEAYSIGFNFSGTEALVEIEGRTEARSLGAFTGGANGAERIHWVSLDAPAECAAITISDRLRLEIADELRAERAVDLGDVWNEQEPVLTALALRLRAAGRGGWEMSSLELEELGRGALRYTMIEMFGARRPRINDHRLDRKQLSRVQEYLHANIAKRVTLSELAAVAHISPTHFQRAFRLTTGLSPHQYQTAWRMNRAAGLIRAGVPRGTAARAVGFTPGHGFRTAMRKFVGMP